MKNHQFRSQSWIQPALALPLGLALSAISAAQVPYLVAEGKSIEWPASLGSDEFGRAELAHLSTKSGAGAVMQWGDGLVYAHAPTTMSYFHDFGIEPAGFGVLRGDIDLGVLDQLIVSTSSGLSAIACDTSSNSIAFTTTAIANTSAASDAVSIACADFTADGYQDIAAVCDDLQTVVVYRGSSSGTFTLDSSFTQSANIAEIQPIQWTHAGGYAGLEIAARSNLGVRVHARSGTVLFYQTTSYGLHDMAVIGAYVAVPPLTTAETVNKLVVITPNTSGEENVFVHSSSGSEASFGLGVIGVVGADAGDFDGDGDWDLALSQRSTHEIRILHNRTFDPMHGEYYFSSTFANGTGYRSAVRIGENPSAQMPSNTARPLLQDITGDGVVDLLMGVLDEDSEFGGNYLYRSTGEVDADFDDRGECPDLISQFNLYTAGTGNYVYATGGNFVAAEFDLANIWVGYTTLPSNVYIEVTVRKQDEDETSTIPPSPLYHIAYWVDPNVHETFLQQAGTLHFGFNLDVVGDEEAVAFFDKYFLEVRMARLVNGQVTSPFSPKVIAFSGETSASQSSYNPSEQLAASPSLYECNPILALTIDGSDDIDYIAEAYTMAALPTFSSGQMVYPGQITSAALE